MSEISQLRQLVDDLSARVVALEEGVTSQVEPLMRLGFTFQEARHLAILMSRQIVSRESFVTLIYGLDYDEPSDKLVDVHILKIRKKLEPFGITVRNLRRGGWYLKPTDKAAISRRVVEAVRA